MMKLIRLKLPFVARLVDAHILIPKQLRAGYQRYYSDTYLGSIRVLLVMATLLYVLFGLLDLYLLKTEALQPYCTSVLVIRYLFGLPILLGLCGLAFSSKLSHKHQLIVSSYVILIQIFLWWMMVQVPDPAVRQIYFSGLMLTQMASLIVSCLQFIPAICSGIVMGLFLLLGYWHVQLDAMTVMIQGYFYLAVATIGLMTSFSNEMHIRNHYFKLRDISTERRRLKRDNDSLHYLAQFDPLTGLANRRQFDEVYTKEWRRAERNRMPISLCMIDIDHFKQYNDHYGHPTGDQCLVKIGALLAEFANRPGDLAVRYGGEEFLLLLPGISGEEAGRLAERICQSVVQLDITHQYSPVKACVTVSAGVASDQPMPGIADEVGARETLLRKADQALYDAKHCGKNRVSVASLEDEGALIAGRSCWEQHLQSNSKRDKQAFSSHPEYGERGVDGVENAAAPEHRAELKKQLKKQLKKPSRKVYDHGSDDEDRSLSFQDSRDNLVSVSEPDAPNT